jgi:WD40 repeat protein
MAQLCRGQSRQLALFRIGLLALSLVILSSLCGNAQTLYERPVLIVDPDMHTAISYGAAADAEGRFLATGSDDKTVRIWSASDGKLLRTIRMPAGPGQIGMIHAVAMSPDGKIVAAGGWWEGAGVSAIYLFDRDAGTMTKRIGGLPRSVYELVFSTDGRYLAATGSDLRVFDRDRNWSEAFRDETYGNQSLGAAFASDGQLATSSFDGKVRLYDRSFKLVATHKMLHGTPYRVAFRPDSKVLAVGY